MPSSPGRKRTRVVGVDAARGIALIGIMAVHILPATINGGDPSPTWSVLAGRSAALFALLAGVSIAFLSGADRRLTGRKLFAARVALAVRALLIVFIGLALGLADSPNLIILTYYGVMFLLAVPILGVRTRWLFPAALASALVWPFVMQLVRRSGADHQDQVPDYTFSTAFLHPVSFVEDMVLLGGYPALPWMTYICAGMAVGRLPSLLSRRTALLLMLGGAGLAVVAWVASAVLLGPAGGMDHLMRSGAGPDADGVSEILNFGPDPTLPTSTWWWLTISAPYSTTPPHLLHTLGAGLLVLGTALLVTDYARSVLQPVVAMGSMTLTLYSAHIVLVAAGVFDEQSPVVDLALQVGLFSVFAVLWRRFVGKGPLEGLLAAVTNRVRTRLGPSPGE